MKVSLFIVICVQAILPFNLRAHSPPLVHPFLAQRPPSHPPPSTQMSLPTPPPWLQELDPGTASALHMTLRISGMDVELLQCRVTEIWGRAQLMAAEQAQYQQRGCTWAQLRWEFGDFWNAHNTLLFSVATQRPQDNEPWYTACLSQKGDGEWSLLSDGLSPFCRSDRLSFLQINTFRWASDR